LINKASGIQNKTTKPKNIKVKTGKNSANGVAASFQWWAKGAGFNEVFNVVNRLLAFQRPRHISNLKNAWFYQHQGLISFRPGSNRSTNGFYPISAEKLTYNVINMIVETVAARISRDKVKVSFITSDGDAKQQRKAKQLTKYVTGQWLATNTYGQIDKVFTDACVFGTGFLHVYFDGKNVIAERCLVDEIVVDEFEALHGTPRQIHRRKLIDKDLLKAEYPAYSSEIDSAGTGTWGTSDKTASNLCLVVESWHLPDDDKGTNGRHDISIDNATLYSEPYNKSYFPFLKFSWSDALDGFYGLGIASKLTGIQLEISKLLRSVQLAMHNLSVPRILRPINSQVEVNHLNNNIDGAIIDYAGDTPPTFWVPSQVMGNDVYQHIETLYKKAFEMVGVSQLSAASQKPKGLDSGIALENYHAIEDERFVKVGERFEQFHIDLANITIDILKDNAKAALPVKIAGRRFLESIDIKDIDLDQDQYIIQSFPSNLLPNTFAGRLQIVQSLIQGGYISQEFGLSLLRFPDIDQYTDLQTANIEASFEIVCSILEDGVKPDLVPYLNYELLLKIAQLTAVRAAYCTKGVDADNLSLLYDLIDQIEDDLAARMAPPPMPAMPMGPAPLPPELAMAGAPQGQAGAPPPAALAPFRDVKGAVVAPQ
jgi:hypothetical protein